MEIDLGRFWGDVVNAAALNSTTARESMAMLRSAMVMSTTWQPVTAFPLRYCSPMSRYGPRGLMAVERQDRDLAFPGFFLLRLGREDTLGGLDFADQTWTPSV